MNENKNSEKPKLLQISDAELKRVLEEHERWLDSDGKEGIRADLSKNCEKTNLT